MGIWFGFPLAFVVCLVSALLGSVRVVPVQVAVSMMIVCVVVCWGYCVYRSWDDMRFSWGHWREARQKQDRKEATKGCEWFLQDLLFVIFSPLLTVVAIILGGVISLGSFFRVSVGRLL